MLEWAQEAMKRWKEKKCEQRKLLGRYIIWSAATDITDKNGNNNNFFLTAVTSVISTIQVIKVVGRYLLLPFTSRRMVVNV